MICRAPHAVLGQHQQAHRVDIRPPAGASPATAAERSGCSWGPPVGAGIDQRHGGHVTILGLPADIADRLVQQDGDALLLETLAILSTSMRSAAVTCSPMGATSPLTLTQPLAIQSSASRREHKPSSAMRLFKREVSPPTDAGLAPGSGGPGETAERAAGAAAAAGAGRPPASADQVRVDVGMARFGSRCSRSRPSGRPCRPGRAGAAGAGLADRVGGAARAARKRPQQAQRHRRALGWAGTG